MIEFGNNCVLISNICHLQIYVIDIEKGDEPNG